MLKCEFPSEVPIFIIPKIDHPYFYLGLPTLKISTVNPLSGVNPLYEFIPESVQGLQCRPAFQVLFGVGSGSVGALPHETMGIS